MGGGVGGEAWHTLARCLMHQLLQLPAQRGVALLHSRAAELLALQTAGPAAAAKAPNRRPFGDSTAPSLPGVASSGLMLASSGPAWRRAAVCTHADTSPASDAHRGSRRSRTAGRGRRAASTASSLAQSCLTDHTCERRGGGQGRSLGAGRPCKTGTRCPPARRLRQSRRAPCAMPRQRADVPRLSLFDEVGARQPACRSGCRGGRGGADLVAAQVCKCGQQAAGALLLRQAPGQLDQP